MITVCLYGLARSVLLVVLTTCIEISYSESSYKKPSTSRYAQGVQCADGVSLTQEHYSMGICLKVFVFYHCVIRCSCCVLLYATKLGEGAGKLTPWGWWSPRTPHEFLRILVRLDRSKGHLIRKRKTGPGWISSPRMGAFFLKISTYFEVYNYSPRISYSSEASF